MDAYGWHIANSLPTVCQPLEMKAVVALTLVAHATLSYAAKRSIRTCDSSTSKPFKPYCDHLKIGTHTLPLAHAADNALFDPSGTKYNKERFDFQFGNLKVLFTTGERDHSGGRLTGPPDGAGVYLKDANTVRIIYQSESYGPLYKHQTFSWKANDDTVSFTGSHIHFVDFDRQKLKLYMQTKDTPADIVIDSGNAVKKIYNLDRKLVGPRNKQEIKDSGYAPHSSNVNIDKQLIFAGRDQEPWDPTSEEEEPGRHLDDVFHDFDADWTMSSLCGASLNVKHRWGNGLGWKMTFF